MRGSSTVVIAALAAGCAHRARPTLTGGELYTHVEALRTTGHATIATARGPIEIHRGQALVSSSQVFLVEQIVDHCRGGDPDADVDCTLALVRDQRFEVRNDVPHVPDATPDDGWSFRRKVEVAGLVIAAPLTYGLAVCSFPGCDAVFGIPLVIDACFTLLALLGPD